MNVELNSKIVSAAWYTNVYVDGNLKKWFANTYKFSNHNKFIANLLQKSVYLFECVNDWKKINETPLLDKEDFYSHLNM